jgi:hypothetical protein
MKEELNVQQQRENEIFWESTRLINLGATGDELLDEALNGREKNADNVAVLWRMVARAFAASMSLPPGRCRDGWTKYWNVCRDFLKTEDWTDEQLKNLRYPNPLPGEPGFRSILDEMSNEGRA